MEMSPLKSIICAVFITIAAASGEVKDVFVKVSREVSFRPTKINHFVTSIIWKCRNSYGLVKVIEWDAEDGVSIPHARFKDITTLDGKTGQITITNLKVEHSGLYTVDIDGKDQEQTFNLTVMGEETENVFHEAGVTSLPWGAVAGIVILLLICLAAGAAIYYRCKISVPQTLVSASAEDEIQRRSGERQSLNAEITVETREMTKYNGPDERFRDRLTLGSGTMSRVIPKSKAKGTDICADKNYYYIIRSDLGCYMQTSDLNKGADISIFSLHPACQNGDHYLGSEGGYFYIIKGNFCRRVYDLSTDSNAVVYSLHPNCQGGDHYFKVDKYFYIIFQEKVTLRATTDMSKDLNAEEHPLHPSFRDGLYYWELHHIKPPLFGLCFAFLKPTSDWGVEFCKAPFMSTAERYSVHPDVLNFLPGGLSVTKGPTTGVWENIKSITNDSNTPMTWQRTVTKKVGYDKEKMSQITHNWKIAPSVTAESGELAKLIAKLQFSFSAEYGGSHVSTEKESWNETTEVEDTFTFELKPQESVNLWQYKLGLGQESLLFCRDIKITNEPNPPTEVPLPRAQP